MRKRGEHSLAWNTYIRILFSDTPKPAPHARLHPKACAKSLKGFIADAATSISNLVRPKTVWRSTQRDILSLTRASGLGGLGLCGAPGGRGV
jgi:hypothetical protein